MADNTKIEWSDATWNPITGCSVVSPGCTNCYAMRLAGTRLRHHPSREGLTDESKGGPVWNGQVRLNEQWLDQPLRWRRPRRIFVCAHGDLFHENVPDEWIDRVFAVMALADRHVFQVLTKRPGRAHKYLARGEGYTERCNAIGRAVMELDEHRVLMSHALPLPNVWIGTSVEDQKRADERVPELINIPAAVRFLSIEPLIGPINLNVSAPSRIDWAIVGGESGPRARDMDPDWARSLREQCAAGGVAFFMKQMARKAPIPDDLLIREYPAA